MPKDSSASSRQLRTRNLIVLGGAVAIILMLNGVISLFALHRSNEQHLSNIKTLRNMMHALEAARTAQVHFKKQVQEWKNILLRGKNSEDFDKYMAGFLKEEEDFRKQLEELETIGGKITLDAQMLPQLKQKHDELGKKYRDALRNYNAQDPQTIFLVDSAVRGIDRAPTDGMDDVVRMIQDRTDQLTVKIAETTEAHYQTWRTVTICGMVAGIVLLFLMLWLSFARLK
jgi:methyl-accepting chemotaxis protein